MSNFGDHQLPVEVIEMILSHLDSYDLLNVCLVSKTWRGIAEKLWLKLLERNVRTLPMWKETYNYLGFPFPFNSNNFNWDEAKIVCHKILFYIQKIKKNWERNAFRKRRICLAGEDDPLQNFDITLGMDYKRIVANYHYLNGNGCIKIWNRASLEQEIVIETYMHAVCLHLSSNFLFASFSDGKIKIWNAKLGELLNSLKNDVEGVVENMCFVDGILVTLSPEPQGGQPCTCLTVQHLSKTGEIVKTNSSLFWGMKSFGLGFDGSCIVFHSNMLEDGDRTFQIRSVENLELLNSIAAPEKLKNFQYKNGLLITTHENTLQIWDVKTGVCVRKLREDKSIFISISFNSEFLLTSYVGGIKIWKLSALVDKSTVKKKCLHSKLKVQSLPPAVTSLEFDNFQIIGFSIRSRSEITILDYCDPPPNISNPVKRRLKR